MACEIDGARAAALKATMAIQVKNLRAVCCSGMQLF
jgi:hypothetical protein